MNSLFTGNQFALVLGLVGFAGCVPPAAAVGRTLYPEYPSSGDLLASDPCSVRSGPDLFVRDAPYDLLRPLSENLQFLKAAHPVFLCGLERIELLGDAAYKASADPAYTRRSVGIYTPMDRVIHLKASAGITLTHEIGHHVHNLGAFAPTVREFMALSWRLSSSGNRVPRCEGPDCFINDAAASQPREDWARTFEMVLMRPIETGVAINFSLDTEGETPLQKKIALMRSITNSESLKGAIHFGGARVLEASEVPHDTSPETIMALPASLGRDTIRRIYLAGKSTIRPSVWDNRRRPFVTGEAVVFPVYLPEKKRLGFFAYDLAKEKFLPLELEVKDLPSEFRDTAGSFTSLEVSTDKDGGHLLIGHRPGAQPLAVPVEFDIPSP